MVQSGCRRDSKSENLGLGGGENVWIRADRNHSDYLFDRLGHKQSVRAEAFPPSNPGAYLKNSFLRVTGEKTFDYQKRIESICAEVKQEGSP